MSFLGNFGKANPSGAQQQPATQPEIPQPEIPQPEISPPESKPEPKPEKEKIDDRDKRPENKEKKFQFLIPEEKYNKMKSSIKNAIKGFMNKLDEKKQKILNKKTLSFEKKAKEASDETDQHNKVSEDGKVEKPWWKLWGGKRRRTRRKKKGRKKKTRKNKKKTRKKKRKYKKKSRKRR